MIKNDFKPVDKLETFIPSGYSLFFKVYRPSFFKINWPFITKLIISSISAYLSLAIICSIICSSSSLECNNLIRLLLISLRPLRELVDLIILESII